MLPRQPPPADPRRVHAAWQAEHRAAVTARRAGDAPGEWSRLERAHVLSQPSAADHVRTHAAMLGFAWRHRDRHELIGQVVWLVVAGPGSLTRRYPLGNTGGADVSSTASMPIAPDLSDLLTPVAD